MRKIRRRRSLAAIAVVVVIGIIVLVTSWFTNKVQSNINQLSTEKSDVVLTDPELKVTEVVTGLDHPWSMIFPTRDVMLYSLRAGEIHGRTLTTDEDWLIKKPDNVISESEGGLLGLALDTSFLDNHYIYACFNANENGAKDVRVERYQLSSDYKTVYATASLVTGIENKSGRHSGCVVEMDKIGNLWIGTGDGGVGSAPQSPTSLAGKVLRITRDGKPVDGNMKAPFDPRIYSYGHRNIQGIELIEKPLSNGAYGYTQEQGTRVEDELNYLLPGNFGYDPLDANGSYKEDAPVTDLVKFPMAVRAVWTTGATPLTTSAVEELTFKRWQAWRGRLMVAALGDQSIHLVELNDKGEFVSEKRLFPNKYGRIRSLIEAPDGNVYVATDNGGGKDKILRLQVICTVCD